MNTKIKLSDVKIANETWFSKGNKKFFGDVNYRILIGKKTKMPYLVRYTKGWSDMFGNIPRYFYVINIIDSDLKISDRIDKDFSTIESVKEELKYM